MKHTLHRLPQGFDEGMLPLLFAHRGLSREFPENTMAAFAACRQWNIPGIELDVHISQDGQVIVVHDDDLWRVANNNAVVEDTSYHDLSSFDVGSHLDSQFHDERIALLSHVLDEFGDDIYFDIELKNSVSTNRGLAPAVAAVIRAVQPKAPLIVSSFNPLELLRFRSLMPEVAAAAIYSRAKKVPWYLRSGLGRVMSGAGGFKPDEPLATQRLRKTRRWVLPWSINDPEKGRRLLQEGAVGLISDDPRLFMEKFSG